MTCNKSPLFAGNDHSYGRRTLCVAVAARFISLVSEYRPAARTLFHSLLVCLASAFRFFHASESQASSVYHDLSTGSLSQNWSNTSLITTTDNWSNVPSIEGFRGTISGSTAYGVGSLSSEVAFGDETSSRVLANYSNIADQSGGVAEFDGLANPVVALEASGAYDHPFLLLYLDSTGRSSVTISYNLRDIDSEVDNSLQQVALQYRLSDTADFINVSSGFVADASSGPSLATLVTPISATLPVWANQTTLQIRIMTGNVSGNDEWIGIDDIVITSVPEPSAVLMFLIGAFGIWRYASRKRRVISCGDLT